MKKKTPEGLAREGATVAFLGAASAVARWLTHVIPEPGEVYLPKQPKALPKPRKSLAKKKGT